VLWLLQGRLKAEGGTRHEERAGGKGKQFGKQNFFNLKLNGLKLTAKPEGEGQNKQELNKPENWLLQPVDRKNCRWKKGAILDFFFLFFYEHVMFS
jgi:hypothetical protein